METQPTTETQVETSTQSAPTSSASTPTVSATTPTVYPWVIIGQPTNLLGSNEGGLFVFYNPSTKRWIANGKSIAFDNKVDLVCEGTTKLVNEANFTFFKITPTDPNQAVFLTPTLKSNEFEGYNCKVDTYRRESFEFGSVPTPAPAPTPTSTLENTD